MCWKQATNTNTMAKKLPEAPAPQLFFPAASDPVRRRSWRAPPVQAGDLPAPEEDGAQEPPNTVFLSPLWFQLRLESLLKFWPVF